MFAVPYTMNNATDSFQVDVFRRGSDEHPASSVRSDVSSVKITEKIKAGRDGRSRPVFRKYNKKYPSKHFGKYRIWF